MVTEQVLTALPKDIHIWVREQKPGTAMEAGQLAGEYLQARGPLGSSKNGMNKKTAHGEVLKYPVANVQLMIGAT